jgi:hypothetical protein
MLCYPIIGGTPIPACVGPNGFCIPGINMAGVVVFMAGDLVTAVLLFK